MAPGLKKPSKVYSKFKKQDLGDWKISLKSRNDVLSKPMAYAIYNWYNQNTLLAQ